MLGVESKVEEKLAHLARTFELEGEHTRTQLAAALSESIRGLRVDGAVPRAVRGGVLFTAGGRLVGWSVRESGGTGPVAVDLYDGTEASAVDPDRLVASFSMPAGGSSAEALMPAGVVFTSGLWAVVSGTGTATGALWRGAVD